MYFVGQGGFKQALSPNRARAERISTDSHSRCPRKTQQAERQRGNGKRRGEAVIIDRISKQCILVKKHYKLSDREAEVMELIARGSTGWRPAETLTVSENTIRTHSKRIYAKLDVQDRKQELVDLVNSFDPRALR